ncbi:MAG: hypothetical protein HYR84_08025 [Planctomycetes bacterium]|nr:hypothetical protein [Planctomycetota bacterium]
MAGLKLLTKLEPQTCLKLAWRTAQDLGFTLTPIDDSSKRFSATKGSAVWGFIAGALSPHCAFEISVAAYGDANEVVLEKNTSWLTSGTIGVAKVNQQADDLMRAIAAAIEKEGGTIMERKEF